MGIKVNQITPMEIYENRNDLDSYLESKLSPLVNETTWMKEWNHIAQRFRLRKIKDMSFEEVKSYEWDQKRLSDVILNTFNEVNKHLKFDNVSLTVFPALSFPWFPNNKSIWTNGFTNGVNNIQIAVPSQPDEEFLKHMIAHELHHATPINPIYDLTFETFSLVDWFKMEGGAEYFALSLYGDKRWWKGDFTPETEVMYWNKAKDILNTTKSSEKDPLCYGDPANGIPYMAGYSFAYKMFIHYMELNPNKGFIDLLGVDPNQFIEAYTRKNS